jgi:hypothetical protein
MRRAVSKSYADWCFERRAQLPPEWTAVDTATTDAKARECLLSRFEVAYPFHPATISVFQRKWQGVTHYQRTRGTLAMFAQWISWAAREGFRQARREPLITLGSAPLHISDFQATILGQLSEQKLLPAIEVDIAGDRSHAKALDAETTGALRDIHRRVGAAILFESTGVATEKAGHLPELRFGLGEPGLDVTSIDNAAAVRHLTPRLHSWPMAPEICDTDTRHLIPDTRHLTPGRFAPIFDTLIPLCDNFHLKVRE